MESVKFLVTLSPAQREALRGAASALGIDASVVVRQAVGEFLAARGMDFPDDLPGRGEYDRLAAALRAVHINVANGRAVVSRTVGSRQEPAANWEALEDEAGEAVEAQGGYITLSGIYACPPELARRTEWNG